MTLHYENEIDHFSKLISWPEALSNEDRQFRIPSQSFTVARKNTGLSFSKKKFDIDGQDVAIRTIENNFQASWT